MTHLKQRIDPEGSCWNLTTIINGALADNQRFDSDKIFVEEIMFVMAFFGGYEPIAKNLFATNYDGFFLEYDSDRAGDFSPLRYWTDKRE